jgi:two-component system chemotaxis response regulator CheY
MVRILVVEDSASTRAMLRAILEESAFAGALGGVEVVEATSGFDAMRALPRGQFDVIVTDINMGDINGLELIHFIRHSEKHRSTPVAIVSTQASERDIERGLGLGANAYIAKPFTAEQIQKVCMRLMGRTVGG